MSRKKPRIAVVAKRFPTISQTFIVDHIIALIEAGYDVDIFAFRRPKSPFTFHPDVEKYRLIDKTHYITRPKRLTSRYLKAIWLILKHVSIHPRWVFISTDRRQFTRNRAINNLLRTEPFIRKKYDVIHCHFGPVANRVAFLRNVMPNTKFVLTFHGYGVRMGLKLGSQYYRATFKAFDHIISICNYNKDKLITLGCPPQKLIDIPNGVDINQFRREPAPMNGRVEITTVARLATEKNILFALHTLKSVKDDGLFDFQYSVIGEGKLRDNVEKLCRQLNLEQHVSLLGAGNRDDVLEKLRETDIFFLPSKKEASPVCLIEAQSMGIPVIATDVGGVKECVKDGITGYLVPLDDVEAAKDRFYRLIKNESTLQEMGNQAREFIVKNFDKTRLNEKLFTLYENRLPV